MVIRLITDDPLSESPKGQFQEKEGNKRKKITRCKDTFLYHMLILFRTWATVFKVEGILCACRFLCIHISDVRMINAKVRLG